MTGSYPAQLAPVVAVGCAPSTGSTLLADLLDAVPGVMCGPELNIFGIPDAYKWDDRFVEAARARRPFRIGYSLAQHSQFFNTRHLEAVGMDEALLDGMIAEAADLRDFVHRFVVHYGRWRGRQRARLAEKTPLNLHCAPLFLEAFPSANFVVLVRDGRSVVASLRRRGYTLYEAALCWLWESRVGEDAIIASDRAVEVRYEDLVADPFGKIREILTPFGIKVGSWRTARRHRRNVYRQRLERPASWRAAGQHSEVTGRLGFDELTGDEISFLESLVLVRPNGSTIDFSETLRRHGYVPQGSAIRDELLLERHTRDYLERSENWQAHEGYALVLRDLSVKDQLARSESLRRSAERAT